MDYPLQLILPIGSQHVYLANLPSIKNEKGSMTLYSVLAAFILPVIPQHLDLTLASVDGTIPKDGFCIIRIEDKFVVERDGKFTLLTNQDLARLCKESNIKVLFSALALDANLSVIFEKFL